MKHIFFVFIIVAIFISCTASQPDYHTDWQKMPEQISQRLLDADSIADVKDKYISLLQDSIKQQIIKPCDNAQRLKRANDSLSTALFLSNYRIEKVRYYLNICLRNKTQDKFLKGWLQRALQ